MISEFYIIVSTISILVVLQSMAGVGILVIGTPFLLILNFQLIEVLSILLPISILTSFLNLIYFKLNKKKLRMRVDQKTKYLFFLICVPAIFFGIFLLQNFYDYINFKYLVSFVIIASLILTKIKKTFIKLNNKIRISFLFFIGTIHGLTNSGGTLLSLFMISFKKKNESRYGITFFYFFLALFQFFIFSLFFNVSLNLLNFKILFILLPFGVFLGNFLIKYVENYTYKKIIEILSLIACIFLLLSNF